MFCLRYIRLCLFICLCAYVFVMFIICWLVYFGTPGRPPGRIIIMNNNNNNNKILSSSIRMSCSLYWLLHGFT